MITLSIRQPWAWAILNLPEPFRKDLENRDWYTPKRGKFLVHAGKALTRRDYQDGVDSIVWTLESIVDRRGVLLPDDLVIPAMADMPRGGIVGWTEIVDCLRPTGEPDFYPTPSPWYGGAYAFVLGPRRGVIDPMISCKGQLGWFHVGREVASQVRAYAETHAC